MSPRRQLIVTNGDVAAGRIRDAGADADLLPWRDALHDGPVPAGLSLEELSRIRAEFLAEAFGYPADELQRGFAARDAVIRTSDGYDRIELWFEHDLYDQLQLVQILHVLAAERQTDLLLVQADDYLGLQPADALRALAKTARPVTAEHFAAANRAWAAFTAPTPEALARLATTDSGALPYLAPALRRLLQELPAIDSGLGLTEERVLAALSESPQAVGQVFKRTREQEDAHFLGDAGFFRLIDGLAFVKTPLVTGLPFRSSRAGGAQSNPSYQAYAGAALALTEAGQAALAGRFDHARENAVDRWFGGTHLHAGGLWRRDLHGHLFHPN